LASEFLDRWSRRKRAAATAAAQPRTPLPPAPALPPLDSVTFESDFAAFMHAKVDEAVRRAALRKLFAAPHFNVMDGLDIYIDDYSIEAPITTEAVALLEHAKSTLLEPPAESEPAEPTGDTA